MIDLIQSLKHITWLLKDINAFRESIALVITKVENIYETTENDTLQRISDSTIIKNIGEFLKHAKKDLQKYIDNPTCTENTSYAAAIKIIDILLSRSGDVYTRIGLFRRPMREGPLTENTLLQNEKLRIKRMIFDRLRYAKSSSECFSNGLPEKSLNDIYDIVREKNNENLWSKFKEISAQVQEYILNLLEDIYAKMETITLVQDNAEYDDKEVETFLSKFLEGFSIVTDLVKNLESLKDIDSIVQTISCGISKLNTKVTEKDMLHFKNQGKYLQFLQTLFGKELETKPWSSVFKDILNYIYDSEKEIQKQTDTSIEYIGEQLKNILSSVTKTFQER